MKANCTLAKLTEQQLDQLYAWLQDEPVNKVRQKIAAPSPEGFDLEVSIDSLGRFYRKRRALARAADALALSEPKPAVAIDRFHHAAAESFAHLTYEIANSPATAKAFVHLSSWFAKREYNEIQRQFLEVAKTQLELSRQRLQLEIFKAQFNAARQALEHAAQLQAILADPTIDNEDKINQARPILFGPSTVPAPQYEVFPSPSDPSPSPITNQKSSIINAQ